jgi:hypothetical protein
MRVTSWLPRVESGRFLIDPVQIGEDLERQFVFFGPMLVDRRFAYTESRCYGVHASAVDSLIGKHLVAASRTLRCASVLQRRGMLQLDPGEEISARAQKDSC